MKIKTSKESEYSDLKTHEKKPLPHVFNAPEDNKGSRFCRCGKYLTDNIHLRVI